MTQSSDQPVQPNVYLIQNHIIEAYPTIPDVPFSSVTEQRGKAPKTSENERLDELYGRCRTCIGNKSGEQLLLCDDCDRGFHMTCLVPVLRDVPKGEWTCPKCTQERLYNRHARATAVVNLKNVLRDVQTRASLPLKLQLKLLNVSPPDVKYTRVAESDKLDDHPDHMEAPPITRRQIRALPPKFRLKRAVADLQRVNEKEPENEQQQQAFVMCKKITKESVTKRRRALSKLTEQLTPFTDRNERRSLVSLHARLAHHTENGLHRKVENFIANSFLASSAAMRHGHVNGHYVNHVNHDVSMRRNSAPKIRKSRWRPLKPRGAACNRCRHLRCICIGVTDTPSPPIVSQSVDQNRKRPRDEDMPDRQEPDVKQRRK